VRNNFPDASKTLTRITAGAVLSEALRNSANGVALGDTLAVGVGVADAGGDALGLADGATDVVAAGAPGD
jgi:hypothetical protein